jgi:ribonuclease HI
VVYTDGGCLGNPGPGGYGAVVLDGETRRELSAGYRLTTNNRMELLACIAALETLGAPVEVILHSDSRYVVNGIEKGWARRWRANGWMRSRTEAAVNCDLWARLLDLCEAHRVRFVWVHGHAGNRENERCDRLATSAAQGAGLREDHAYVQGLKRLPGCPPG